MFEDEDPPSMFRVPAGVADDPHFQKKYEIERELGVGGAGIVFCARHRELDERVAIKFLLAGPDNAEALARVRREARAANRVKSEHVVRIVDVSTPPDSVPYVVMEYLEGTDLERLLHESPDAQLPVRDAIDFVLQACEALAECHAIGIVHRDLKPSNLFCTHGADGLPIIKVLDFGISKLASVTVDEAMTGRNAIMGSPRYMSPEQFATPADVDHRTDIWALGIILYELVTGQAPFVGNTLIALWERVKTDVPKAIGELRRDAPRALNAIVLRCLEKDPADRYQNVAELAKALLPLASERSRTNVARIVRIVESPGVTTAALSLPPSGRPSTGDATSVSVAVGKTQHPARGFALAALVAAGATALIFFGTRAPSPASRATPKPAHAPAPPPLPRPATPITPTTASEATTSTATATATPPVLDSMAPAAPAASAAPPAPSAPHGLSDARGTRPGSHPASAAGAASVSHAAPAAIATATPLRTEPLAVAAVAGSTAPDPASPAKSPPWVLDIVERRKGKAGGSP